MSVRQYDEQPFPYQLEAYHELERGQWIEVRRNDVDVAVGSKGVVLKQIAETGNYQVAVEVEGKAQKRIVALCPDQVRPCDPPLPAEPSALEAALAIDAAAARPDRLSPEARERQRQATRDYWARKRAEKEAAAAKPDKPKRAAKLKPDTPPADPALMTRHRPEGMDERIAAAVLGTPPPPLVDELADAIRHVQAYRETPAPARLVEVTWTKRAADAIRPVLAEAAAAGGEVTQLALLVETISYLEDGGRP